MNSIYREALIGLLFTLGIISFIAGQFIISTVLFAVAAIFSNVYLNREFYG